MLKIILLFVLLPVSLLHPQSDSAEPFPFTKIGRNLYKIEADMNSIIASIGPDGVLLCDAGGESKGPRILATIRELGGKTIDIIIDTHWHADHTGGNLCFGKDALIIAHENVKKRLSQDKYLAFWDETHPAFPAHALPDLVFSKKVAMSFNGEEIEITHLPGGHTDGDAIVYFRKSNILHAGDCVFSNGFPAIDFEMGGSVEGFAECLNRIAAMMPSNVRIVPGHGPDYSMEQLKAYETMVRASLLAVREAMQQDMSVAAMQEARLVKEWEHYSGGLFTCDGWINMVYRSLIHQSGLPPRTLESGSELKGPYLGQRPPGMTPEIFAPGFVSTREKYELNSLFSPKGDEFYYEISTTTPEEKKAGKYFYIIMSSRRENGIWTEPRMAPFSGKHMTVDIAFAPDGNRFYFCSNRTDPWNTTEEMHIWYVDRTNGGWSKPAILGPPVYCPGGESQPSVSDSGTLYFTSSGHPGSRGGIDLYYAEAGDGGGFSQPVNLGEAVNSPYHEGKPFIAPDESFLLFTRWGMPEDMDGGKGLFISFKRKDGSWTTARNTKIDGSIAKVTPDGKYLFFSRGGDVFWVDAGAIEAWKPAELRKE